MVGIDGRLGLAPRERRFVHVRFHEPLDDGLRAELFHLLRRCGSVARRVAERVDPIEFGAQREPHLQHVVGRRVDERRRKTISFVIIAAVVFFLDARTDVQRR